MEKKNIASQVVLKHSAQTTLNGLMAVTGIVPEQLMQKARELNLTVTSPQIWQYTGSDGQPETQFLLEICLPVNEAKGDPAPFEFAVLSPSIVISQLHHGAWNRMGETYQKIIREIQQKGLKMNGISREIYLNCDFENQENCLTEIQVSISE